MRGKQTSLEGLRSLPPIEPRDFVGLWRGLRTSIRRSPLRIVAAMTIRATSRSISSNSCASTNLENRTVGHQLSASTRFDDRLPSSLPVALDRPGRTGRSPQGSSALSFLPGRLVFLVEDRGIVLDFPQAFKRCVSNCRVGPIHETRFPRSMSGTRRTGSCLSAGEVCDDLAGGVAGAITFNCRGKIVETDDFGNCRSQGTGGDLLGDLSQTRGVGSI